MRILCLLDFPVRSGQWLWDYLPEAGDEVEFLTLTAPQDRFSGRGKLLSYYPAYWRLGWKAIQRVAQKDFDLVMAWEAKNGFPYAVLRRLLGKKSPPLVIAAFNYRRPLRNFLGL